jgi:hypothetical protein|tara:strand:+ start:508 stop:1152 length:645 start_codon:yes stop_codon:yes gene_type:complete
MKKYILDLCCGTQSLKHHFEKNGVYIGLDINKSTDNKIPTIITDLKTWDYKTYFKENGFPFFIWFSPPCNEYSILNNARPNKVCDIEGSNKIVQKGIEIIKYCNCNYIIENPQTSKLKKQSFMTFNFTDVDYCSYGYPYKKRTRLWNNFNFIGKKCLKSKCPYKKNGRHLYSIGNSSYKTNVAEFSKLSRLGQRYSIPPKLIEDLFLQLERINN